MSSGLDIRAEQSKAIFEDATEERPVALHGAPLKEIDAFRYLGSWIAGLVGHDDVRKSNELKELVDHGTFLMPASDHTHPNAMDEGRVSPHSGLVVDDDTTLWMSASGGRGLTPEQQ
eukprot:Selendium_serpulae@DN3581_c0_g1_i1.p1